MLALNEDGIVNLLRRLNNKPARMKAKFQRRIYSSKCAVLLPYFSYAFSDDVIASVHRQALTNHSKRQGILLVVFYSLYWPIAAGTLACFAALKIDCKACAIPLSQFRFFISLWALKVRHNITTDTFLHYKLWLPERKAILHEYLQRHEIATLLDWLNRHTDTSQIECKASFDTLCQENGIESTRNVAVISNHKVTLREGTSLPKRDLFSKTDGMFGGSDAQAWTYDPVSSTWSDGQHRVVERQLLNVLETASAQKSIVVQLSLTNHETMTRFSSGALCTFRVVTFKLPRGRAEHFRSVLRMPVGEMSVDNFGAGGLAAGIDDQGRLTSAVKKGVVNESWNTHPDTNAPITGIQLPFFDEIVNCALNAHNLLTDIVSVGWDIAWTQHGPIIVEGNVSWGGDTLQIPSGIPLGQRFCELYESAKHAT